MTAFDVIERVTRVTPLGVRFWDSVASVPVSDGLLVRYPRAGTSELAQARASSSEVFVLSRLPGLRSAEQGDGTDAYWSAPPAETTITIEVDDLRGRFHSFSLEATAPAFGLVEPLWGSPPSPPSPPSFALGVPLFSTPSRLAPQGVAVIRAELRDATTDAPAAWARVQARASTGGAVGVGIADRRGVVAVFLPVPPLERRLGSPPAVARSLADEEWTVTLSAFYSPLPDPDARPALRHFLDQRSTPLLSRVSPPTDLPPQPLRFGRDLIVRPVLHVYPAA